MIDLINSLPSVDELTLEDKEAVESARSAYEDLTDAQKGLVPSDVLAKLEAAEERITKLEAGQAAEEEANNFKVAHAEALSLTVEMVSIDDGSKVEAALAAYAELSESAQAKLAAEKTLLDDLLTKIEELEQEAKDRAAADEVIDMINALPSADELTLEDKEAVESARSAYERLTDVQKALVQSDVLAKLESAEERTSELESDQEAEEEANNFKETYAYILALTEDTVSISNKEAVNAALTAYAELSEVAKVKLTGEKSLLDSLLTKIEELVSAVQAVVDTIDALPKLDDLTLKDKEAIGAARTAFNDLTDEQKALVANRSILEAAEGKIAELEITVDQIGDETVEGLYIVNIDYTDNSVKSDDIGPIALKIGDKDVTQSFNFIFYDQEGGHEITTFDLSNGATTFRVFMEATSEEYKNISTYVVFKYRSVTIGDNDEYYTIEDALAEAELGDMVYVKYNTSFADTDIAEEVYDSTDFTIKSGVTLLLPYSSDLSSNTNDTPGGTSGALSRDNAYVELTIPTGIELNVDGTLTINAMRANISTRFSGHVTGTNYAQLHLKEDSKITVKDGGILNSIGFVYGNGIVEALSGSNVYESMFVKSFRGGRATLNVYSDVFPFDQYTVNNIEVDMTINSGSNYTGNVLIYASSSYVDGSARLVGSQDEYLLQLTEGKIIKTYDHSTGRVSFEIQGNANINNTSFRVGGITANSSGRDLPFDGTWSITAASGSNITINSWVMLLPGASVNIEPEAEVTVSKNGKITVFDPYEHIDTYNAYPVNAVAYYRTAPEFDFGSETPATLNVDGTLVVEGGLAGRVHKGETGSIDLLESAFTTYDVKYVYGSAGDATVYSREVSLWYEGESTIAVVANPSTASSDKEIVVTATVKDAYGNPLEGVEVVFSGGNGSWSSESIATNSNGKAESAYTVSGDDDDPTRLIVTEQLSNKTAGANIEIGGGGCPLIYSFDGQELHLEHEPVPTSANKAFEGTSFGTLRKLKEVDGQYHIRVTEDDISETYINGVNIYAVEYATDSDIKEIFVDINGKPHTIRDRMAPKSFLDSECKDWIDELTTDGRLVSAPGLSMLEQGQYVETYIATFDLPEDASDMGKLMIRTQETNLTVDFVGWYHALIDGCYNVWWLEKALQKTDKIWGIIDAIGLLGLDVELWNGTEWVYQGTVESGSHFFEEFLIPIDISLLGDGVDEVKVRFKSGSGFVMFDQVSIDFSPDQPMTVYPLDLQQALRNGHDDVTSAVANINDQRVKLQKGDYLDLFFFAPDLADGYERGLFVDFTGYYHWGLESKTHPIVNTWDGLTYEEILTSVLSVQPEAAKTVEVLEWLFDLTESTLGKSMEYKIENIYVGHALPWMKENLWHQND